MRKMMLGVALVGSLLFPTLSTFAADLPFGLAMGMSPDKIPAIQSGALKLDSTKSIMGNGTNCVDHFLAEDGYPSWDSKKYKESVSDFVQRADVFPGLDVSLYQVDISGKDATYKGVCLGFVSSRLTFVQVPRSSIPDIKAVISSLDNKFKRTKTNDDLLFPAYEYIWQSVSGVEVSYKEPNSFHSLYSLIANDLGSNRLRYSKIGHDNSIGKKLKDLYLKKGMKRKKSKDF